MKTVLWVQASDTDSNDLMVIDGEYQKYVGSVLQKNAYEELINTCLWAELTPRSTRFSSAMRFYCKGKEKRKIHAYYEDRDIAGRPIAFMFQSENTTLDGFIDALANYSCIVHKSFALTDYNRIKELENHYHTKQRIVKIGLLLLLIIIVFLIWQISK